jgi:hypothetical protein
MTTNYYDVGGSITFTSVYGTFAWADLLIAGNTIVTDYWCKDCTRDTISLSKSSSQEPDKKLIFKGMPVKF